MKSVTFFLRVFFIFLSVFFLLNWKIFLDHFLFSFSRNYLSWVITNNWFLVILNILFFISFLFLLRYRKKVNWHNHSLYVAFIVSLFIEMYGIPLTIFFVSNHLMKNYYHPNDVAMNITLLGNSFGVSKTTLFGGFIVFIGTLFVIIAWYELFNQKRGIAHKGIYMYSRHPQYFGLILVIIGWFIVWPSLLTLIMCPLLVFSYIRLSYREEKEINSKFYEEYKKKTPFFI